MKCLSTLPSEDFLTMNVRLYELYHQLEVVTSPSSAGKKDANPPLTHAESYARLIFKIEFEKTRLTFSSVAD